MKKIVMGLSGGMDSATLLGLLLEQGYEVHCCSFHYGSKHNPYELKAADDILYFYYGKGAAVKKYIFDLRYAFSNFQSNLMAHGGEIPEGHYASDNMKKTVVPGRNLIFISLMAGLAESVKAESVVFGAHSGDHHIYPDCRPEFVEQANRVVYFSSDSKVTLIAPFLYDDKKSILERGYSMTPEVPYELTRTCYKDQEIACGKCGSCQERLEAFEKLGKKDPIRYMDYEP